MPVWRKSSACSHSDCVEVQFDRTIVRIRNSRRPSQTVEFTADEWDAFLLGALAGEFGKSPIDQRDELAASTRNVHRRTDRYR